jgi:hypothetical protein
MVQRPHSVRGELSKFTFSKTGLYFKELGVGGWNDSQLDGQTFSNADNERNAFLYKKISSNIRYLFNPSIKGISGQRFEMWFSIHL